MGLAAYTFLASVETFSDSQYLIGEDDRMPHNDGLAKYFGPSHESRKARSCEVGYYP